MNTCFVSELPFSPNKFARDITSTEIEGLFVRGPADGGKNDIQHAPFTGSQRLSIANTMLTPFPSKV